jgi:hypothetical protein
MRLTHEQLSKVDGAVRRGDALMDPELAAAAVVRARELLARETGPRGRLRLVVMLGLALALVVDLVRRVHEYSAHDVATLVLLFVVLRHVYLLADRPRADNLRRAERLNTQVLETQGQTAPSSLDLEPTLEPSDEERARAALRVAAVATSCGIAAAIALTSFQNGHDTGSRVLALAVLCVFGTASGLVAIVYATKARRLPKTPVPLLGVIGGCFVIAWCAFFLAAIV